MDQHNIRFHCRPSQLGIQYMHRCIRFLYNYHRCSRGIPIHCSQRPGHSGYVWYWAGEPRVRSQRSLAQRPRLPIIMRLNGNLVLRLDSPASRASLKRRSADLKIRTETALTKDFMVIYLWFSDWSLEIFKRNWDLSCELHCLLYVGRRPLDYLHTSRLSSWARTTIN